jgi:hypothetical protein
VHSPAAIGTQDDRLLAVGGEATGDVWAIGVSATNGGQYAPVAEVWTGSGWVSHPPLLVGDYITWLEAVAVVSPTDVWAAGQTTSLADGRIPHPVIEHWNGTTWKVVPVPSLMANNTGSFMTAGTDTSGDVWFAGWQGSMLARSNLIARWNGSAIKLVTAPQPQGTGGGATLSGVDVTSAHNIWAIGDYQPQGATERTEVFRKLSKGFKLISSPSKGTDGSALAGVDSVSNTDAWSAGYRFTANSELPLVEHWDGRAWTIVANPSGLPKNAALAGVATTPTGYVFAVGSQRAAGVATPLLIQRCPS